MTIYLNKTIQKDCLFVLHICLTVLLNRLISWFAGQPYVQVNSAFLDFWTIKIYIWREYGETVIITFRLRDNWDLTLFANFSPLLHMWHQPTATLKITYVEVQLIRSFHSFSLDAIFTCIQEGTAIRIDPRQQERINRSQSKLSFFLYNGGAISLPNKIE